MSGLGITPLSPPDRIEVNPRETLHLREVCGDVLKLVADLASQPVDCCPTRQSVRHRLVKSPSVAVSSSRANRAWRDVAKRLSLARPETRVLHQQRLGCPRCAYSKDRERILPRLPATPTESWMKALPFPQLAVMTSWSFAVSTYCWNLDTLPSSTSQTWQTCPCCLLSSVRELPDSVWAAALAICSYFSNHPFSRLSRCPPGA